MCFNTIIMNNKIFSGCYFDKCLGKSSSLTTIKSRNIDPLPTQTLKSEPNEQKRSSRESFDICAI